jgi:sugar O-acyltransferase (sialic acid O-acetyltransferase NeuD family)
MSTPSSLPLLVVFGAGGHGRVVADAALASRAWRGVIASDRNPARWGGELLPGVPIVDPAELAALPGPIAVHVAIGDNATRRREAEAIGANWPLATVIHPSAAVAASARIDAGCLIAAQAVVAPCCEIGAGVVVNHAAVIDHDCRVEAWAHVAPGARLGGAVRVGAGALVGAGSTVLRDLCIGAGATLGAGAVALASVPDAQSWAGVPARPIGHASA